MAILSITGVLQEDSDKLRKELHNGELRSESVKVCIVYF